MWKVDDYQKDEWKKQRRKREAENKNPSQQREKRIIHPPTDMNDVSYDSDRVK